MSIIILWSSWWGRERAGFVILVSRDCCVAIPLSGMGLSAVCDCDTHLLFLGDIHANSDGFGESAHLLGLVWAFVTVQNSHVVTQMAIVCHFVRAAKDLASLHICTGLP